MSNKNPADIFTIKASHYMIAAFGLATALSWNSTVKDIINASFPRPNEELRATIVYSIVMTLILVMMIWCFPDTKSELPAETRHKINMAELHKKHMQIINDIQMHSRKL